jgi:hypothetical protein
MLTEQFFLTTKTTEVTLALTNHGGIDLQIR